MYYQESLRDLHKIRDEILSEINRKRSLRLEVDPYPKNLEEVDRKIESLEKRFGPVNASNTILIQNDQSNNLVYNDDFYIRKENDDFRYHGRLLDIRKNNDWYKVFCILYKIIPNGGDVSYEKLEDEIKMDDNFKKKTKNRDQKEMRSFILKNLTDSRQGFMGRADISKTETNGKPLLKADPGKGINFNNKAG